jgi:membrane-associated phospholipid phosphatase
MFRAADAPQRAIADDASTVLLYSMVAAPYVGVGARSVALQGDWRDTTALTLVNSEAFGVAFAMTSLMKGAVGRERPFATAAGLATFCATHPTAPSCGSDRNASFPSGHSAVAFTGAGLLCMQHVVFGGRDMDGCAGGVMVAGMTAMLRIVADMHYATDTLVGATIGMGAGMLIPYVLHFARWAPFPVARKMRLAANAPRPNGLVNLSVAPWGAAGGGGIAFGGQF